MSLQPTGSTIATPAVPAGIEALAVLSGVEAPVGSAVGSDPMFATVVSDGSGIFQVPIWIRLHCLTEKGLFPDKFRCR
jgi:hypothetical protein